MRDIKSVSYLFLFSTAMKNVFEDTFTILFYLEKITIELFRLSSSNSCELIHIVAHRWMLMFDLKLKSWISDAKKNNK